MSFLKRFLTPVTEEYISEPSASEVEVKEEPLFFFPFNNDQDAGQDEKYENDIEPKEVTPATDTDFIDVAFDMLISEINKPKPKAVTVESFFADKKIDLTLCNEKEAVAPVESLAFTIAINYPHTKPFIRFLRDCINKKSFDFTYSIAGFSQADKIAIVSLAEKLNEYCLISNYFNNKVTNTIRGTVSSAPRCINFINGDFLELYAKSVTIGVIKKAAEKYGLDYEFHHNLHITKDDESHELDIVFRIGDQVFWEEIKSSDFDADKYRKIGLMMGVIPDKLILLAAEKSNEATVGISYLYECYCANINTFKNSLIEMIDKAFVEEK